MCKKANLRKSTHKGELYFTDELKIKRNKERH